MLDEEKIRKEGFKLIEEFSRELECVPETEETHYVMDVRNIVREDAAPVRKKDFPEKFKKIVPKWDEGYVSVEKGV